MSWGKYRKVQNFSLPIENIEVTNIDKDSNEKVVTISYRTKFIDSARFMASSLSNLVDNPAEGIHTIKCKDCECFFEYDININAYLAIKIIQTSLMKNLKSESRTHLSFLTMISMILFCC